MAQDLWEVFLPLERQLEIRWYPAASQDTKHIVLSNPGCLARSDSFSSWKPWGLFWKNTLFWGFVRECKGQKNSSCPNSRRCTTVHGEFAQNHSPPLENTLGGSIPGWEHIWGVTQGSSPDNHPPPSHPVLRLGPSQLQGYNTILFNTWWKARSASEMQLQELLAHWEGLHHLPSDCNSLTSVVLLPLPHTMQYSPNVMRPWHEVRSSFIRRMKILTSFVDGKKPYHKCCYGEPAKSQHSEEQTESLKNVSSAHQIPLCHEGIYRAGKHTGKWHPENLPV